MSGQVEMSNVDLAGVHRHDYHPRGFQANARLITTAEDAPRTDSAEALACDLRKTEVQHLVFGAVCGASCRQCGRVEWVSTSLFC